MRIAITAEAQTKLNKYLADGQKILLDLDDGFGRFSDEGTCALLTKFRILIVPATEDLSDYPVHLDSPMGTVYFKDSARDFLDNDGMSLKVDPKTQLLIFANTKETIDKSVNIINYEETKI